MGQTFSMVMVHPGDFFDNLVGRDNLNGLSYYFKIVTAFSIIGTLVLFPLWAGVQALLTQSLSGARGFDHYLNLHSTSILSLITPTSHQAGRRDE
ncbi:MAG: hypothetical protein WCI27_05275 [Candidatus Omnitrophota bacterium]